MKLCKASPWGEAPTSGGDEVERQTLDYRRKTLDVETWSLQKPILPFLGVALDIIIYQPKGFIKT